MVIMRWWGRVTYRGVVRDDFEGHVFEDGESFYFGEAKGLVHLDESDHILHLDNFS